MALEITPRETILKRVRQAVIEKTKNPYPDLDLDSPLMKTVDEDSAVNFADAFTAAEGQFVYCAHQFEFIDNLISLIEAKGWTKIYCTENKIQQQFTETGIEFSNKYEEGEYIEVAITLCEALISSSGSVLVSSKQHNRSLIHLTQAHVVVAHVAQIAHDIKEGFTMIKNKYGKEPPSWMSLITGPSRTADIERTRIVGMHGASELYVFLIDNQK
jgi:L-lactate dehydrogenase complex protein LldG